MAVYFSHPITTSIYCTIGGGAVGALAALCRKYIAKADIPPNLQGNVNLTLLSSLVGAGIGGSLSLLTHLVVKVISVFMRSPLGCLFMKGVLLTLGVVFGAILCFVVPMLIVLCLVGIGYFFAFVMGGDIR